MAARKKTAAVARVSAKATPRVSVVRDSKPRSPVNVDLLDTEHTTVRYGIGQQNSFASYFGGVVANLDEVLARVAGYEGVAFYKGMWRRHPWLEGICDQMVEKACRPRVIVPGDPSDPQSVKIAGAALRHWNKVNNRPVVLPKWLKNAKYIGYGVTEKVFMRDPNTGLVYAQLINRECENVRFKADGTALFLSITNPIGGEIIPPRKMMFLRGGSVNTPYGEAELKSVYPVTYWLEKAMELAFDSIEEFGRPIPVIYMPRAAAALSGPEREAIRAMAREVHRRFLEVPTDESKVTVSMDQGNMAASGAAGRPEMAIVEMCITWAYIRILRTVQTLNKTQGSFAQETVRDGRTDDASRPASQLLDNGLNAIAMPDNEHTGWLADFHDYNFPNEPADLLARFESPTMSQDEIKAEHDRAMSATEHGVKVSSRWYFKTTGLQEARDDADILGTPRVEPLGATVTIRENTTPGAPVNPSPPPPDTAPPMQPPAHTPMQPPMQPPAKGKP